MTKHGKIKAQYHTIKNKGSLYSSMKSLYHQWNILLHKRFFIVENVLHTKKKKRGYFKNCSVKGSLVNQKWFFYRITFFLTYHLMISPLPSWKPQLHLSAQLPCFFSVETHPNCHSNVNNSPIIMISFPRVFNRCTALPHHTVKHMLAL